MLNWLRRIDDAIFSPPHKFEIILPLVASRLGSDYGDDSDEHAEQGPLPEAEPDHDYP